jgi:hypothetical protein
MNYAKPFLEAFYGKLPLRMHLWAERCRAEHWDKETRTRRWTDMIIRSAQLACEDLEKHFDCELRVDGERIDRIDVHAQNRATDELLIAFESEQGRHGFEKSWRYELVKLCKHDARIRVVTGFFKVGTGRLYTEKLVRELRSYKADFATGKRGEFLLIFGPEYNRKDPDQPGLAYTLSDDMPPPCFHPKNRSWQLTTSDPNDARLSGSDSSAFRSASCFSYSIPPSRSRLAALVTRRRQGGSHRQAPPATRFRSRTAVALASWLAWGQFWSSAKHSPLERNGSRMGEVDQLALEYACGRELLTFAKEQRHSA